jgi:predicted transglutaminase-like protease
MDLKLNIDGVEYSLDQLLPMYAIASYYNQLKTLQDSVESQVQALKDQINSIEPDEEKQLQAIQIVQFILSKFPR